MDKDIKPVATIRRPDIELQPQCTWFNWPADGSNLFTESALTQAREEGRREGMREARRIASTFSLKKISIHPDIEIDDMNETARVVYHSTCQCVALEIDEAITRASEGK